MKTHGTYGISKMLLIGGLFLPALAAPLLAADKSPTWADRARQVAAQRLAAYRTAAAPADALPDSFSLSRTQSGIRAPSGSAGSSYSASNRRLVTELDTFSLASDAASQPADQGETATATKAATIERGPLPNLGDTILRDLKEAPDVLWHDTKKVYGNPWNLVFLIGAGGVSAAMRPEVDDDIEDFYDKHHTFKHDWRDAFGAAGNPATHFGFACAWYLLGQTAQDAKTYEVGKRAISALSITGVTTVLLKLAACTDSPNGEEWAWPSGHVSSTMALATVLNDAYGPLVGLPMFGLTGLVAVERLDDREHSFSDVVFGAALGWVVAETVMKEHQPEIFGGQIVPYLDRAGTSAGVAWVKNLGN